MLQRVASAVALSTVLWASVMRAEEEEPKAPLFAEPKKDWAWDEDKRFDFLMERLASLEASLDAVDVAIAKASGKRGAALGKGRTAERGNEMMDRKGGGPMRWNEFYGTTAEKFFYHPVDPNTTYHTVTALQQMGNTQDDKVGSGVPSSQSVPVHQRPPQFDYIYRANRDAQAKAEQEALAMAGKIEELNRRKFELEKEQAELWCLLAFRAIQKANIPRKPLLRFQLVSASTNPSDIQKAEALSTAARFLAIALLIIEKADSDQSAAFGNVKTLVTNARNNFDDSLLNADAIAEDLQDKRTTIGKYVALAQLLDDTANNLSDSNEVAMEGDEAKDLARKDRFRGLLQRSLVEYAQIVLALDELLGVMKKDWKISVDTKTKAAPVEVSWGAPRVKSVRAEPSTSSQGTQGAAAGRTPANYQVEDSTGGATRTEPMTDRPEPKPKNNDRPGPKDGRYRLMFRGAPWGLLFEVRGTKLFLCGDITPKGDVVHQWPSVRKYQKSEEFKLQNGKLLTDDELWALTWDLATNAMTVKKKDGSILSGTIQQGNW